MALTQRRVLNELLIRWGDDGALKGAHCVHLDIIDRDGAAISSIAGGAEPLTLGGDELIEVLSQVQNDALSQLSLLQSNLTDANKSLADANAELDAFRSQH